MAEPTLNDLQSDHVGLAPPPLRRRETLVGGGEPRSLGEIIFLICAVIIIASIGECQAREVRDSVDARRDLTDVCRWSLDPETRGLAFDERQKVWMAAGCGEIN